MYNLKITMKSNWYLLLFGNQDHSKFLKGSKMPKMLIVTTWHLVSVCQCSWNSFEKRINVCFHLWHHPQGIELPWRLTFFRKSLKKCEFEHFAKVTTFCPIGFELLNDTFVAHFSAFWKIEVGCNTIQKIRV